MFFVPLQVGMKNVLTKVSALLLVVWYSLSVIGFDVHTCSKSGRTFIATVVSGTACEDIHPDHLKSACSCCHHHSDDASKGIDRKPCCTDDWQYIALTGMRTAENDNADDSADGLAPVYHHVSLQEAVAAVSFTTIPNFYNPDSGIPVPVDFQRAYNIWRI